MVHQPEFGKNTSSFITDVIEICLNFKQLDTKKIKHMYEVDGLSASQIASHFGVARTSITARLHKMGIRPGTCSGRISNPKNYRVRNAPYGYMIQGNKLVLNKKELPIVRLVVNRSRHDGKSLNEIARELEQRGYKNRAGSAHWDSRTIFNILKRWKDKI